MIDFMGHEAKHAAIKTRIKVETCPKSFNIVPNSTPYPLLGAGER